MLQKVARIDCVLKSQKFSSLPALIERQFSPTSNLPRLDSPTLNSDVQSILAIPLSLRDFKRVILLAREIGKVWDSLTDSDRLVLPDAFMDPKSEQSLLFSLRKSEIFGLGQFFPESYDYYRYHARSRALFLAKTEQIELSSGLRAIKMTADNVVYSELGADFTDCQGRRISISNLEEDISKRANSMIAYLFPISAILAVGLFSE